MGLSVVTLALAKKFTKQSLIGLGALKGAPCIIKEIIKNDTSNIVTFEWTGTDDSKQTSTMMVENGISIKKVEVNEDTNELIVTLSDNSIINGGKIKALKGDKGDPGFSPIITENAGNNTNVYKLDITTEEGTFTTPNLQGSGGGGDFSNYYTKEETETQIAEALENYPTNDDINEALKDVPTSEQLNETLKSYSTIEEVNQLLADYPTSESLTNNYYSKEDADAAIDEKISEALGEPVTDDELDSLFP